MPGGWFKECAFCNGKSALVDVLTAHSNLTLLKEHYSWQSSQAVAPPDAWCMGWSTLSVIRIWTHLKTNSLAFEDDFT